MISKKVTYLQELVFSENLVKGMEDTVVMPMFNTLGLKHGFSLGPGSKNMSERFAAEGQADIVARVEDFLRRLGMATLAKSFLAINPNPQHLRVVDITQTMVTQAAARPLERPNVESVVTADCLFTTVPNVPLLMKAADCPDVLLYGIGTNNTPVIGLVHAGRPQVNEDVVPLAILHMIESYGVAPHKVVAGIAPGIPPKNYFIQEADSQIIDSEKWDGFALQMPANETRPARIHLDVTGKIIHQLLENGILPSNIQAYGDTVDTYELASQNPHLAFSHRYATETGQPHKNGRFLVAIQL